MAHEYLRGYKSSSFSVGVGFVCLVEMVADVLDLSTNSSAPRILFSMAVDFL